jgi:hypothetical protein
MPQQISLCVQMNPNEPQATLGNPVGRVDGRTSACPDEEQLAAYVDGTLVSAASEQLELHLADCTPCLELVGLLSRERDAPVTEAVPEKLLDQARTRPAMKPRRWLQQAPRWAAAAMLLVSVPLLIHLGRSPDRGNEGQGSPAARTTRNIDARVSELKVIAPVAGTALDPRTLSFRWTPVAGSPYYDVRIVSDAGDLIVKQRVTGTEWRPPARLNLVPGAEYFVHVDAYPSGNKAMGSEHVPFRVAD